MKTRIALFVGAAALIAGCSVPGLGQVNPPPIADTGPPTALIPPACADALTAAGPNGVSLLNGARVALGADAAGAFHDVPGLPSQTHHHLEDLRTGAQALGVTACDDVVTVP